MKKGMVLSFPSRNIRTSTRLLPASLKSSPYPSPPDALSHESMPIPPAHPQRTLGDKLHDLARHSPTDVAKVEYLVDDMLGDYEGKRDPAVLDAERLRTQRHARRWFVMSHASLRQPIQIQMDTLSEWIRKALGKAGGMSGP